MSYWPKDGYYWDSLGTEVEAVEPPYEEMQALPPQQQVQGVRWQSVALQAAVASTEQQRLYSPQA